MQRFKRILKTFKDLLKYTGNLDKNDPLKQDEKDHIKSKMGAHNINLDSFQLDILDEFREILEQQHEEIIQRRLRQRRRKARTI